MDPDPEQTKIMLQLPNLRDVEEMFIARVHIVMKVHRLSKGAIDHQGNMLNMEQDLIAVIDKLTLLPEDFPMFDARKENPNAPGGCKDFNINKESMLLCLVWLKTNNSHCADVIIDHGILDQLPTDGSEFHQLRSHEENDDANDETEEDMGRNEPGPGQVNAIGDAGGDEIIHATEACAAINPGHQSETMQQGILNMLNEESQLMETENTENLGTTNNPMPFTEATNTLNDCVHQFMQSLAFPILFPCGAKGDVTDPDRVVEVAVADANNHSLKHCMCDDAKEEHAHPFAEHNRWMHWAQNTSERHRANGQKNVCSNKNSEDDNLTQAQLKTAIENVGEELQKLSGRMQKIDANISGSNACFVKRRKESEALMEQEGMCTAWFSLSAADNHWLDLNKILHGTERSSKSAHG